MLAHLVFSFITAIDGSLPKIDLLIDRGWETLQTPDPALLYFILKPQKQWKITLPVYLPRYQEKRKSEGAMGVEIPCEGVI